MRGEVVFSTDVIGDPVIVRSDGRPQYNFAVVVDDALMEVTHVIRGEDHISNTPRQILLYEALGFTPPEFAHLSLVLGPDHTPLSKRHGATSVAEFRARGYLPEALVNYLALIGWSPRTDGGSGENDAELLPVDEMARRFALEDVGHSAGVFDDEKLAWMNRHYLKAAAPARLAAESVRFFTARGYRDAAHRRGAGVRLARSCRWRRRRSIGSRRFPIGCGFCSSSMPPAALRHARRRRGDGRAGRARGRRGAGRGAARRRPARSRGVPRRRRRGCKQRTGQKGQALFHPIRVALTGEAGGPELDLAVPAIDRGAELPRSAGVPLVLGCRERAAMFARTAALMPGAEASAAERA